MSPLCVKIPVRFKFECCFLLTVEKSFLSAFTRDAIVLLLTIPHRNIKLTEAIEHGYGNLKNHAKHILKETGKTEKCISRIFDCN